MRLDHIQSVLFVPGARPDRFAKALATAADFIVIDLEDAVGPDDKATARSAVVAYLATADRSRVAVRVNQLINPWGLADLLALAPCKPHLVFVPKVESGGVLAVAHGLMPDAMLAPLIESPAGLAAADAIARAPGVAAIMLGGVDYASELGVAPSWDALVHARGGIVAACARAGVASIDVPYLGLDDAAGCEAEARRVASMGMTAKSAIHPAQIAPIRAGFSPGADEIAQARAGIAAFRQAGGGVARLDGRLLEAPVVRRFERVLARAGETVDA